MIHTTTEPETRGAAPASRRDRDAGPESAAWTGSADADGVPALVGRGRELAVLRARWAEAAAERGGVVALGGEPGIGKTRLARAFAADAAAGGAAVLWGRCFEGEGAPPYGPWTEVLGELVRGADPARARGALAAVGAGAASLGHLLPALRALLPDEAEPAPLPPAEERFRLHDAAARFLFGAAGTESDRPDPTGSEQAPPPLLLVLDDVHWADPPSLALFGHLARRLDRSRVLIVATYRDGALDRDHPLSDLLADLRREAGFVALPLKGLDRAEVTDLLRHAARHPVDPELGRAIHGETGGNPFYVREVMRHLLDEGALVDRDGGWAAEGGIRALGVPDGVRQVVGRRLARLSAPTRRLLDHAAVFAAGVDFPVLLALTGLAEEALLAALDEALAAQLLRPVDGRRETYEFAHAIVRHALVAESARNPSRAARLHRRAAEALARVGADNPGSEPTHAAELAIQYHASAALPGADRGVPAALAAAEQARHAYARERAVFFLRLARDLSSGLDAGSRASILCRLATAEAEALLLEDAQWTVPAAVAALAAGKVPPARAAEFLATLASSLKGGGAAGAVWRPLVERGLALLDDDRGLTWARLALLRDPVAPLPSGTLGAGRWLGFAAEAVRVARRLGDEDDQARTIESFDVRDRDGTRRLVALARGWSRPTAVLRALTIAANDLQYRHGAFAEALALWREVAATAEQSGAVSWQAQAVNQRTWLLLALGEFAAARAAATEADALLGRLGPDRQSDALRVEMEAAFARYLGGDWADIAARLTRIATTPATDPDGLGALSGPLYAALGALAQAQAGAPAAADRLLAALTPALALVGATASNQNQNGIVALAGEALWLMDRADLAPTYRGWVHELLAAGVGDYPQTSLALTLARLAVLLGEEAEAEARFAQARAELDASGQRPLRAIVDHDEGVALLRRAPAETARAVALLEAARTGFAALGMEGWEHRARLALDRAAAVGGRPAYPAGLSERETQVIRLVARGHSDRQVADALYLSPRTVNAHVRNMLTKTERANRTELSVWAVEQGLVVPESGG